MLEIDQKQMKVKVFSDDLADALRNDNSSIEVYFQKRIKVMVDGEPQIFEHLNTTIEGDSHWITFKFRKNKKGSFEVKATYLMELFPDQTNVLKVMSPKPQFYKLTKSNQTCSFSI